MNQVQWVYMGPNPFPWNISVFKMDPVRNIRGLNSNEQMFLKDMMNNLWNHMVENIHRQTKIIQSHDNQELMEKIVAFCKKILTSHDSKEEIMWDIRALRVMKNQLADLNNEVHEPIMASLEYKFKTKLRLVFEKGNFEDMVSEARSHLDLAKKDCEEATAEQSLLSKTFQETRSKLTFICQEVEIFEVTTLRFRS